GDRKGTSLLFDKDSHIFGKRTYFMQEYQNTHQKNALAGKQHPAQRLTWPVGVLFAIASVMVLASCTLVMDNGEAEPVAISLPTYTPPEEEDGGVALEGESADGASDASAASPEMAQSVAPTDTVSSSDGTGGDAVDTESMDATEDSMMMVMGLSSVDALLEKQPMFTYNGDVLAKDRVAIVAEASGMVLDLTIGVGDRVFMGDVVARIDSATLEAQRAQALAGLSASQAQLELTLETADSEDVEAAQAAVAAAQASYDRLLQLPDDEDLRIAQAQIRQTEAAVSLAQSAFDEVKHRPEIGMLPQSLNLQNATLQLEAARAQYEKAIKGPTADAIAGAYAQLASARAQLARVQEGPKRAQIQSVEAQVKQAETNLYLSQLRLDKATARAPIDGIVTQVNTSIGAMASQGSPIAMLLSPEIEIIISIEEFRLSQIQVGQPALIRVEAYPDLVFLGEVAVIAPELDAATRTFKVTVRPAGDAMELLPGMFATVDLFSLEQE
ncbi:MAG: efflux RND transporter periplasmic adaptor subunit, partial [Chloroflexota bacterium]